MYNSKIDERDLVTVVMSVYRTERRLLVRAVESIFHQTYDKFEFVIIDDGADENCKDYLNSICDDRIILISNEQNIGLAASLNKGIQIAHGKYIVRMDADDYSYPERLSKQIGYLEDHDEIDVLACISMDICHGELTGGIGGAYRSFDNETMKIELSFGPKTFPHPTVVFRTAFLKDNNIRYDESFVRAQDYDMWARCVMLGRLASLQMPLLLYNSDDKETTEPSEEQIRFSNITKLECLYRLLPDATDREKELYVHMKDMKITGTPKENILFIRRLVKANDSRMIYDRREYREVIYFWWGRKMFYSGNLALLPEFLKDISYTLNAVVATMCRLPGHICQRIYERKLVRKITKEGIQPSVQQLI